MTAPTPLVVIGAGGFGREALDVVEAVNAGDSRPRFDVRGVLDDAPSEVNLSRLASRGVPYLGTIAEALAGRLYGGSYVLGVGNPAVRAKLDDLFTAAGLESPPLAHPAAGIGSNTSIGYGSVVCAGVQVSTNVSIGQSVHLNPNATVGHDAVLEDYVSVNPGAVISGECHIGRGTLVGAAAVVLQGVTVGGGALVGAAACVTRDVPPGLTVKGVPAR
ncbi:acetyltransferase [Blastococcus sp. TF02-09]|uniref:NeuD/PglB/VioB family sugar acetyltransferase n=1 Tax=Blastococcus sp. TF02-09 TaxID=2250576 RepID=UPI000DEACC1C|nr:NeuD/PglB/VioB family sugar acetyltransferase [Blastococcus sp. TF02-9]RBY74810.1 acetyltransferase [Blastococcus sp. TF02-9]